MPWHATFLVILCLSCGDKGLSDEQICRKMSGLCQGEAAVPCFGQGDWAEMESDVGKATVKNFRACVARAGSCEAFAMCIVEVSLKAARSEKRDVIEEEDERDDEGDQIDERKSEGEERAGVTYDAVTVRTPQNAFGNKLSLSIELTVNGDMPHVAAHVSVTAFCGEETDQDDAFFMSLSDAQAGDRRTDTVTLFDMGELQSKPTDCELILELSEGASQPQKFCFRDGATSKGACR